MTPSLPTEPGDTVTLTIKSGATTNDVKVTLGDNPAKAGTAYLGLRYQSLPSFGSGGLPGQLPPFGRGGQGGQGGQTTPHAKPTLPNNAQSGAALRSIAAGSPAEAAGLQQGDIVTAIDGQAVNNPQALVDAVTAHNPGDKVTLTVTNNGAERQVTVTLGDNPNKAGTAYLGAALGGNSGSDRQINPGTTPNANPNGVPSRPQPGNRQPNRQPANGRTTA